ncbi:MAG: bifunctional transaldolase/phosoglucose isomerase [Candidatus Bipolaricaulia bacterium]
MNLKELHKHGQSIWLDYIRRSLITSGELQRLVEEDGLRGVTSNPTIFEKAIAGSTDYDDTLTALVDADPHTDTSALYETLAIEDIQMAADVLRSVYDETDGADGFVSLEVSPHLAHDTEGTIAEARRLWQAVDRPNLMIKAPATPEGIPAIETLIAEGINVNVTLIFSLAHYEAVAHAYIRGLERSTDPRRVASVASLFVSRIDTAADRALEEIGTPEALALRGKIAIANAKMTYQRFREIFYDKPVADSNQQGARVQRPLWASTGTKNPAYSDVLYVEELIGPDTVNTLPPSTLNAFRDHGRVQTTVQQGLEEAQAALARLAELDVDLDAITEKLQADGVDAFANSFDQLLGTLKEKRRAIQADRVDRQTLDLGTYHIRVEERLQVWQSEDFVRRLWSKDPALWFSEPVSEITDRLGWLDLPETMHEQLDDLRAFADEVKAEGMRHVVLLGMGGSSLAPEVFQRTFGNAPGYPELVVLDSTHPAAVRAVDQRIDPGHTLFLVSSKSGTTLETLSLFRYFWNRAGQVTDTPGRHFVAITDPGTPLEQLAHERGFRHVFQASPDVGGRYSALTAFGLVPAALIGMDVHQLLDQAWTLSEACAFCVPESDTPCLPLGAALGELARAGRDKVTFLASPSLEAFPTWLEQLIAESTGKDDTGILPVADEPLAVPEMYGSDRLFVHLALEQDDTPDLEEQLNALEVSGHPVARIHLTEKADLGQEILRWEVAVAAAGAVLGIHPFNQPDVQLAKDLARQAMGQDQGTEKQRDEPVVESIRVDQLEDLAQAISDWLSQARSGDYVAVQAYLAPTPETTATLQEIRLTLRDRLKLATTLGYGPRFLHSTGQLHKGGPNTGLFLQLVDEPTDDLPVPETDYTFGTLIRAQAQGDNQALKQRGRRVLRVNLGGDASAGLKRLAKMLP